MSTIYYTGPFRFPLYDAAASRVLHNAKLFRECGYKVEIISWGGIQRDNDRQLDGSFSYLGFRYIVTNDIDTKENSFWKRFRNYLLGSKSAYQYIKQNAVKDDVVIIYNPSLLFTKRMLALSLVCSFHLISDITEWYDSSEVPGRKLFLFYWLSEWNMKRIQRQVEKKIVISSFLKDYYKNENVILLPPLIDLSDNKWTMSSSVLPPFSGIRLIYAGSTNKSKDLLAIMIKAVISCVKKGLILQLIIVGIFDKDKYDFISKKDFAEFGKNILFLGKIDQTFVPQYYLSSDFSLFVRRHSRKNMAGFPTKFVESMAACTPVITNRTSDIEMYLKHNENGLLVDDFTESELSKVLVCISQFDKAKIQRMKVGAYKCAMKNFDYKCYVNLINSFMK